MGLVDSLRMNNIYPSGGNNPLQITPTNTGINLDEIDSLMRRASAIRQQEVESDRQFQREMFDKTHNANLANIAAAAAASRSNRNSDNNNNNLSTPRNVIYRPDINEYQKGLLKEGQEKIDLNKSLGSGKLAQGEEKIKQTGDLSQQKIDQAGNFGQQKIDATNTSNDIRQQRANIYSFKATHPEMKLIISRGGNFFAVDPITGRSMDTGVNSGTMTDEDKINLTSDKKLSNSLSEIGARGSQNRQTQNDRLANQNNKSLSPTQQNIQYYNRANALLGQHPEWKDVLTVDPQTKSIKVNTGDQDLYHEINKSIYDPATDINLPKDNKSGKQLADPLGIRPKSDDNEDNNEDENINDSSNDSGEE